VAPAVGSHQYPRGTSVIFSAGRSIACPGVWTFDHWVGDVFQTQAATTLVVADHDKTITAAFTESRQCGDECHPVPASDFNQDCLVNWSDFTVFAEHWFACTAPACD
jgi:hypothetical protein